jgi:hypothetical protein
MCESCPPRRLGLNFLKEHRRRSRPVRRFAQAHMKHLNQLRRLADNKKCATCGYEDRMGFKDVCMKFKIFICSDCKSAHQAFSHRCKVRAPTCRARSILTLRALRVAGRRRRWRADAMPKSSLVRSR